MKSRKVAAIIIILSLIGLVDAAYSTYEHYEIISGSIEGSFCDVSPGISCSAVNGSAFSEIFGIPTALLGVLWFLALLFLAGQWYAKKKMLKNPEFLVFLWSIVGLGTVFWLLYAEYVIGAICLLCTVVHIIVVAILILSYTHLQKPLSKYIDETFYN